MRKYHGFAQKDVGNARKRTQEKKIFGGGAVKNGNRPKTNNHRKKYPPRFCEGDEWSLDIIQYSCFSLPFSSLLRDG